MIGGAVGEGTEVARLCEFLGIFMGHALDAEVAPPEEMKPRDFKVVGIADHHDDRFEISELASEGVKSIRGLLQGLVPCPRDPADVRMANEAELPPPLSKLES